jgi:hypothetical protein
MSIKYKIIKVLYGFRYDLPNFLKNLWRFRKGLLNYRSYDPYGIYVLNNIGLSAIADHIEKYGYEVDESRLKKVEKMRRAAQIYKNFMEDNFIEQAEAELGELIMHPWEFVPSEDHPNCSVLVDKDTPEEKEHNSAIFKRSTKIEEEQWAELYTILKGQDYSKFSKKKDFNQQFDGSGLRGWWG